MLTRDNFSAACQHPPACIRIEETTRHQLLPSARQTQTSPRVSHIRFKKMPRVALIHDRQKGPIRLTAAMTSTTGFHKYRSFFIIIMFAQVNICAFFFVLCAIKTTDFSYNVIQLISCSLFIEK